jgi:hypothetical protein
LKCTVKAIIFIKGIGVYRYLMLITSQYLKVPILAVILDLIKSMLDASRAQKPKANKILSISPHSCLIIDMGSLPQARSK